MAQIRPLSDNGDFVRLCDFISVPCAGKPSQMDKFAQFIFHCTLKASIHNDSDALDGLDADE